MDRGRLVLLIAAAALLLACARAQRPFYASGGQYPGVLPQNAPATDAATDLDLKFGAAGSTDPYGAREKDPLYNVEKDLVDRVKNDYPRDKQPYWYVNAAQLNDSRRQQQQLQAQIRELNEQLRRLQDAERAAAASASGPAPAGGSGRSRSRRG